MQLPFGASQADETLTALTMAPFSRQSHSECSNFDLCRFAFIVQARLKMFCFGEQSDAEPSASRTNSVHHDSVQCCPLRLSWTCVHVCFAQSHTWRQRNPAEGIPLRIGGKCSVLAPAVVSKVAQPAYVFALNRFMPKGRFGNSPIPNACFEFGRMWRATL